MRCREILHELDAYLTGELDNTTKAQVERHLEECADCRKELELLRKENAVYREYAGAMDVSDNALKALPVLGFRRGSAARWRQWAAAAAVLVAALTFWRFHAVRIDDESARNAESQPTVALPVSINQAMSSYEQAVQVLEASYEGKRKNLDPDLVRILDRNLQIAEAAIAECKLALKKYPDHPQAIQFLLLNYEKQVGILKQITEAL